MVSLCSLPYQPCAFLIVPPLGVHHVHLDHQFDQKHVIEKIISIYSFSLNDNNMQILTPAGTVPSSPRALLALPWSSTQVLLSWAPPDEPQGILVNYTVSVDGKVGTCKEDTLQVHRCEVNIIIIFAAIIKWLWVLVLMTLI